MGGTFSWADKLPLSLLFGSLDLRGLEVPKSSKGRWSRSKSSRKRCCEGEAAETREESETASRDAMEGTAAGV